jgi:hypothetical protein
MKKVKRAGRGFQCLSNYCLRALLSRRWRRLAEETSFAKDQNPYSPSNA